MRWVWLFENFFSFLFVSFFFFFLSFSFFLFPSFFFFSWRKAVVSFGWILDVPSRDFLIRKLIILV